MEVSRFLARKITDFSGSCSSTPCLITGGYPLLNKHSSPKPPSLTAKSTSINYSYGPFSRKLCNKLPKGISHSIPFNSNPMIKSKPSNKHAKGFTSLTILYHIHFRPMVTLAPPCRNSRMASQFSWSRGGRRDAAKPRDLTPLGAEKNKGSQASLNHWRNPVFFFGFSMDWLMGKSTGNH